MKKIVVKVQMTCDRCRAKALQVGADSPGVDYVGLEGAEKDRVVVVGNGVDAIRLTSCLRKRVGSAELVSVADIK